MQAFKIYKVETDQWVDYGIVFESESQLTDFLAQFPKYVKVKASSIGPMERNYTNATSSRMPMAHFQVFLMSNGSTGEVNEAGIKRLTKFREIVDTNSIEETAIKA